MKLISLCFENKRNLKEVIIIQDDEGKELVQIRDKRKGKEEAFGNNKPADEDPFVCCSEIQVLPLRLEPRCSFENVELPHGYIVACTKIRR